MGLEKKKIKENMNKIIKDKAEKRIHWQKHPSIDMKANNGNVILQIIVVHCNAIRRITVEKIPIVP